MNYIGEDSTDPARISTLRAPNVFPLALFTYFSAASRNVLVYSDKKLRENRVEYCLSRGWGEIFIEGYADNENLVPPCLQRRRVFDRANRCSGREDEMKQIVKTIRGWNDAYVRLYSGRKAKEGNWLG